MNIEEYVLNKVITCKRAEESMNTINTIAKNNALLSISKALKENFNIILEANKKDIENANKKGLSKALIDRILLDKNRIFKMADSIEEIIALDDPIGEVTKMWTRPNGIRIGQMRVPIGVLGIIYEARPNVTVDSIALCLKSGNCVILKGGSEALNSNIAIYNIVDEVLKNTSLPKGCVQFIDIPDREAVNYMLKLNKYIDVLIPRGGANLINSVIENSTIPVIQTGVGNCHLYVDKDADEDMAISIAVNGKVQRPAVCNALETLLVHKDISNSLLPKIGKKLTSLGVVIKGCNRTKEILPYIDDATEEDFKTEYLQLIIAIKIVDSIDDAISHIHSYGTKHSEAIITNNYFSSQKFLKSVDAACVYVNASTRFTDGGEMGFGAEIGISTQKLHARGPMGLKELTTTKYIIYGEGQIRE